MKILIIQEAYPPDHSGAGIDIKRNYEYLIKQNNSLDITVLARKNNNKTQVINGILIKRILYKWSLRNSFKLFFSSFIIIKEIFYSNIIHFNGLYPVGLFFIPIANFFGKRTLLQIHVMGGDDLTSVNKRKNGQLFSYFYLKAKYFKTYSDAQTESLINNGVKKDKILQVPPFIDKNIFFIQINKEKIKTRRKLDIPENAIVISTIGRIGIRKGTDVVLDVFNGMKEKYPNLFLLLIGPANIREFKNSKMSVALINNLKETSDSDNRIRLLGKISNVSEVLQTSNFFLLPSRDEGFGIVLIEAMACGIPTIVSNLKGVFDKIINNNHDGIIIDSYSSDDYIEIIDSLINNKQEYDRISINASRKVEKLYSSKRTLKQFNQFINNSDFY